MGQKRRSTVILLLSILVGIVQLDGLCDGYIVNAEDSKEYLRRYEPVFYNASDLSEQHIRARRRAKNDDDNVNVEFFSHGRNFQLNLNVDEYLFHPNAIIENSAGPIKYNTRKALSGTIKGEPDSAVHGILSPSGVFDGYMHTEDGQEYYMEPKRTEKSSNSIMYRPEDVVWQTNEHSGCASHELNLKVNEERRSQNFTTADTKSQTRTKRRARWAIDPKKKTCMLYLQADHLFYERFGSEEACIDIMTKHIQRVNDIYKTTDFDNDGKPDDITFMIKRVKVHTANHTKDPSYRYNGEFQVIKYLELFSEGDYDSFCLAYMFTFRDFEGGTLGLAWTADLKNAGGVCEKKGHFRGGLKSLNTGIITLLNYGKVVPPSVSYVTLAHEIGHNFGAQHDPEMDKSCVPGGEDGNYIMFARATAGDRKNNNKFSPCSLRSILPVLNIKARDLHGCFTEPQESICGNGVVEKGEECDCGWEEDCKESCCFPMRLRAHPYEPPCRLRPSKSCSPSQGPCCTGNCTMKSGDKCRDDNGCRDASFCDGFQPFCPQSVSKPNKTVCNKESVCFMGECTGSICLAYGLESCQCNPEPWESSKKLCELCCKVPGEGNPCLSSFQLNDPGNDVPDIYSKPGSPCKNYTGYCDAYQTCREIDPAGPLATLRKLLLADEGLAFIADWIDNHWYAVIAFVIIVILFMIGTAQLCGKRAKARLRKLTVMHSNVEAIQIQRAYLEDVGDHTVHPVAVRKKIPFKKKVRERRSKHRNRRTKDKPTENANPPKAPSKFGGTLWRKRRPVNKSNSKKAATEASHELPQVQSKQREPLPLPVGAKNGTSSLPTPVEGKDSKHVASSSTTAQLPQITHEVNTAIVPLAKGQKSKSRKNPGKSGYRKSKERPSNASKPVEKRKTDVKTKSHTHPPTKKPAKEAPQPHSDSKRNIQVLYRAPFSVKVQVVPSNNTGTPTEKKEVPASPPKRVAANSISTSNLTPRTKPSSSFLQRRQKNHLKKSKNPSHSELRVLISPHNEDDDLQSPITPIT